MDFCSLLGSNCMQWMRGIAACSAASCGMDFWIAACSKLRNSCTSQPFGSSGACLDFLDFWIAACSADGWVFGSTHAVLRHMAGIAALSAAGPAGFLDPSMQRQHDLFVACGLQRGDALRRRRCFGSCSGTGGRQLGDRRSERQGVPVGPGMTPCHPTRIGPVGVIPWSARIGGGLGSPTAMRDRISSRRIRRAAFALSAWRPRATSAMM